MNNRLTAAERAHLSRVKELPCAVCGAAGPSDAHHIRQHLQFTCIPLCYDCHRSNIGIHGTKALWKIRKMDELDALDVTIRRICNGD